MLSKDPLALADGMCASQGPGGLRSVSAVCAVVPSRPTTHADPIYRVHGSVFSCVANMPGALPHTSTYALTNATLPYVLRLANLGWEAALAADPALANGLSTHRGALHSLQVAHDLGLPYTEPSALLAA